MKMSMPHADTGRSDTGRETPRLLSVVVPCYNEAEV